MRCLSFYCLIAKKSINQEKEQRRRNLESLIDKLDENSVLKWLVLLEFGISPNQQLLFQSYTVETSLAFGWGSKFAVGIDSVLPSGGACFSLFALLQARFMTMISCPLLSFGSRSQIHDNTQPIASFRFDSRWIQLFAPLSSLTTVLDILRWDLRVM